jgi:hypothetical protein
VLDVIVTHIQSESHLQYRGWSTLFAKGMERWNDEARLRAKVYRHEFLFHTQGSVQQNQPSFAFSNAHRISLMRTNLETRQPIAACPLYLNRFSVVILFAFAQ